MKSGNLNFLEPSGPLQACNGTALPLPLLSLFIIIVDIAVKDIKVLRVAMEMQPFFSYKTFSTAVNRNEYLIF
jgi:hypothetical protein